MPRKEEHRRGAGDLRSPEQAESPIPQFEASVRFRGRGVGGAALFTPSRQAAKANDKTNPFGFPARTETIDNRRRAIRSQLRRAFSDNLNPIPAGSFGEEPAGSVGRGPGAGIRPAHRYIFSCERSAEGIRLLDTGVADENAELGWGGCIVLIRWGRKSKIRVIRGASRLVNADVEGLSFGDPGRNGDWQTGSRGETWKTQ